MHRKNKTTEDNSNQCHKGQVQPLKPTSTATFFIHNSAGNVMRLLAISHAPVRCPISVCGKVMGARATLPHYLRDHCKDLAYEELYVGQRNILEFNSNSLKFTENTCLGVLVYGGIRSARKERPADRGLCLRNGSLSEKFKHLEGHLPILIMACLTAAPAMFEDSEELFNSIDRNNRQQHVLVLWLASVETAKPIYCTLSVYDKLMTTSRSTIIALRSLTETHEVPKFLPTATDMLFLTDGDIDMLTRGYKENIYLETIINEE